LSYYDGIDRVVFEKDGVALEKVTVSDHPPTVEVTTPIGVENLIDAKTITWIGSDNYHTAVDISDAAFSVGNKAPAVGVDWLPFFMGRVTIYVLITDAVPGESNVTNNLATVEVEVADSKAKMQLPIILLK
jgi:hypothetical protein